MNKWVIGSGVVPLLIPHLDGYVVTTSSETGGSSIVSDGTHSGSSILVQNNTSVTFTATPSSGYTFGGWYNGNVLVSSNATYTTTITSNLTLVAKFNPNTTITVVTDGQGTATVNNVSSVTVAYGSSVTLRATPTGE